MWDVCMQTFHVFGYIQHNYITYAVYVESPYPQGRYLQQLVI